MMRFCKRIKIKDKNIKVINFSKLKKIRIETLLELIISMTESDGKFKTDSRVEDLISEMEIMLGKCKEACLFFKMIL